MSGVPAVVQVVLPPGSVVLRAGDEPHGSVALHAGGEPADPQTALGPGSPARPVRQEAAPASRVALVDSRIGSRRRLRRQAARLGLTVRSEYVVLPTWGRATFVVEDDRSTLGWLLTTLATVPPGLSRAVPAVDLGLRVVRRLSWPHRALALAAPGRVLVGEPR